MLGVVLAVLLLAPALASALVVHVKTGASTTAVGLQPTSEAFPLDGNGNDKGKVGEEGPGAGRYNNPEGNPVVEGNPTTHSVDAYVIYWENSKNPQDPQDLRVYPGEWQGLIDGYMSNLSAASETGGNDVFTVDTQYTDLTTTGMTGRATGRTRFLGAYTDTNAYPKAAGCTDEYLASPPEVTCVSDAQLQEQLHTFIGQHGLQTGMGTIFFVLTPPGIGVCVGEGAGASPCSQDNGKVTSRGFCSYHSFYPDRQYGTILYAAIPWTFGDAGGLFGTAANPGDVCQDGGWNVNAEKGGPLEQQKEPPQVPQEPNQLPELGADGLWDEGVADLVIGQLASEQQNTITDPLLNAWQDKEKLGGEEVGYENTDECRNFFLSISGGSASKKEHTEAGDLSNQMLFGGAYYANDAFNLAAQKLSYPGVPCLPGIRLIPAFTEPPTVNSGEIVGFNGMESDITLNVGEVFTPTGEEKLTYPTFTWNFGDGSPEVSGYAPGGPPSNPPVALCEEPWLPPCAASAFHDYQYGGVYKVTLTVKDVAGNVATVERVITVIGPPPPAPPAPPAPSPTTSAGAGGPGSGGPGAAGSSSLPAPVATAAAVSSSLKQVARSGLVVRYSVNEQVTGRFEVLLSAATANHLGISGPAATNLPAGFPKSLVIGHALLVTLKGGRNSVRIKFSKKIAKRLRRAHKVTLTLRMIVRNASPQNPLFTTVSSNVVLHR
ncbi:MAG: PKD domain-containing protein [Solirubrobacteraceae bacterium]